MSPRQYHRPFIVPSQIYDMYKNVDLKETLQRLMGDLVSDEGRCFSASEQTENSSKMTQ